MRNDLCEKSEYYATSHGEIVEIRNWLGTSRRVPLQEAREVLHVQGGRHRAPVAVGVRAARRVLLEEAGKVLNVQHRGRGAPIAVCIAGLDRRRIAGTG